MPSSPRSSLLLPGAELSREAMSMNTLDEPTLFVLSNTRTCPVFWTTYQRAALPGACSIAMGCVNVRFGKTRCAAIDVAAHGIRINAVSPSLAIHPFLAKVTSDELLAELKQREAFGRAAEPWEVANVMVFLASDYASYMTGEVVAVSSQQA